MKRNNFIKFFLKVLGKNNVIFEKKYLFNEFTNKKKYFLNPIFILKPKNEIEIIKIIKFCNKNRITIIPQGGNTGVVLGNSLTNKNSVILNFININKIYKINKFNNTVIVESGCILNNFKKFLKFKNYFFPLSLASGNNCTIGGNLSTNAGGNRVIKYGQIRNLCLGLKIIDYEGNIINNIKDISKDNSGFDILNLFIGSEGTLGIIISALFKIFPLNKLNITIFIAFSKFKNILILLKILKKKFNQILTKFEIIPKFAIKLINKNISYIKNIPFSKIYNYYILLELSNNLKLNLNDLLLKFFYKIIKLKLIKDIIFTDLNREKNNLWKFREYIPLAQRLEGDNIKHDISLPIKNIYKFIKKTELIIKKIFPYCRIIIFGHIGDGNIHYNIFNPIKFKFKNFNKYRNILNNIIYDNVNKFEGSLSAEHGIGLKNKKEMIFYKTFNELNIIKNIKFTFDPNNIFNTNKII